MKLLKSARPLYDSVRVQCDSSRLVATEKIKMLREGATIGLNIYNYAYSLEKI